MNPLLPPQVQQRLVLASASPRRRELLAGLGLEFTIEPSRYHEDDRDLTPEQAALAHALGKAQDVARRRPGALVIGADTVVVIDGEILGKPADAEQAAAMLRRLSGVRHEVLTGVALVQDGRARAELSRTAVDFRHLAEAEIAAYVASAEAFDKAGAYGIQGLAAQFVTGIQGCYFNVMGLPLELLTRMLRGWPAGA